VVNLYEAYPSVFFFLKCFKVIHDAGIAVGYPKYVILYDHSPKTQEFTDSVIQSEPEKIIIRCAKYINTIAHAHFRKRPNFDVQLSSETFCLLHTNEVNQIIKAMQQHNNNIISLSFYNFKINSNDFILLVKAMEHANNQLERLCIVYNEIDFEGCRALANVIINPSCRLNELELNHNGIRFADADLVENAVNVVRQRRRIVFYFEQDEY
jgi:hypothetical protein